METIAKVAILLDKEEAEKRWRYGLNVFEVYIQEVLSEAGISFHVIDTPANLSNNTCDIVVVALMGENQQNARRLINFAEAGGTVINYGALQSMSRMLDSRVLPSTGPGYTNWMYNDEELPLRFLKSNPWHINDGNGCHSSKKSEFPTFERFEVGLGRVERSPVCIADTIVLFQQGNEPVLQDGIPADDGSGDVDDQLLKTDDAISMDWKSDRRSTATGEKYFAYPYADWWRYIMIGHLLQCALERRLTIPFIGRWPKDVSAVGLISHDSDINTDESAKTTLELLRDNDIKSTWCMLEPGYSPSIYHEIKEAGHELALHYNALEQDGGCWGPSEFSRQCQWFKEATESRVIVSNKNHYTRFEGWSELFEWCEAEGILSDQTRGPSKKGNVGFLFGTCLPYFPVAWSDKQNRFLDVLEIHFLTQDINHPRLTDTSVIEPFLQQVKRIGGVAHFLFHQIHLHRIQEVRDALQQVVKEAKAQGFVFWTGKQINDWIRWRRQLRIETIDQHGDVKLNMVSQDRADSDNAEHAGKAVFWIPVPGDHPLAAEGETHYGVTCLRALSDTLITNG